MARRQTKSDLVKTIRVGLDAADALGEWAAAAHLNQALVALIGEGAMPKKFEVA